MPLLRRGGPNAPERRRPRDLDPAGFRLRLAALLLLVVALAAAKVAYELRNPWHGVAVGLWLAVVAGLWWASGRMAPLMRRGEVAGGRARPLVVVVGCLVAFFGAMPLFRL